MECANSIQLERRTAHYKPNIWNYDHLASLVSNNNVQLGGAQVQKLKEDFIRVFDKETDVSKLQIIDDINKLGLNALVEKELMEALDLIQSGLNTNNPPFINNIESVALCFRLLRHHGYNVSQGLFTHFLKKEDDHDKTTNISRNTKGLIELYEASHLAFEDENSLIKVGELSHETLKHIHDQQSLDKNIKTRVSDALELPLHWTVQWFNVRNRIDAYELDVARNNPTLLKLAKLNFNMVQSIQQKDLRDLTRWWKNLSLIENISFARDRLVESFLWTVGVAYEPQYSSLRKCVTKVVTFVLVLDDLYDVFGSLDELKCFTRAVERWSWDDTDHLPECMEMCFRALYDTTNDIAKEMEGKTGCPSALIYLKNAWADFCRALLVEAKWYSKSHIPSLKEYLGSAWISSSGPLLSLVVSLMAAKNPSYFTQEVTAVKGLVYYSSVIIRLCNDLGATAAELERGDSASSILCYMREANVTEEAARRRVKDMISDTWRNINGEFVKVQASEKASANLIINTARVCHFIYNKGDGFGVQDGDTKTQIKRVLLHPLLLY
ncbi:hypothetical protein V2J09_002783 [Rumex salicifolius]